jgi:hypothetical protein
MKALTPEQPFKLLDLPVTVGETAAETASSLAGAAVRG